MRNELILLIIFLFVMPALAASATNLADMLEFSKANREAMLGSLEVLDKRVSELEKITYLLQLDGLHEEALKLMSEARERKRLIEQGETIAVEDLTLRASALESETYKTIEKEALEHINTNSAQDYQEINDLLADALKKKDMAVLADALFAYRTEMQKTDTEQLKRLNGFQQSQKRINRIKIPIAIVVFISVIISFVFLKKSAHRRRNTESIGSFIAQASSNPSSVSRSLIEDPAVQTFLRGRISEEERRILGD